MVVPVLLTTREALDQLIGRLEIDCYFARAGLAISNSLRYRTGPMPRAKPPKVMRNCARQRRRAVARLNHRHRSAPGGDRFLCCTAGAYGMRV